MDWFESTGTLIYDPHGRSEKTQHKVSDPWWALLFCEQGLIDYANYWLTNRGIYLYKHSLYGGHISVIKGEEPPDKNLWKKSQGRKMTFKYSNKYNHNHKYWWIFVECPELSEIRKELGLNPNPPYFPFHLTIGRVTP